MTETVVLIVEDRTVDLVQLAEFVQSVGNVSVDGAVLTFQRGDEYCYLVKVSDPEVDGIFEDWPEARVPNAPSAVFSVDYRAPDLIVALVHEIAKRRSLTVDTNYGQVVSGRDLVLGMLRPV